MWCAVLGAGAFPLQKPWDLCVGSRLILSWRPAVFEFPGPSAVQNLILTRSWRKESPSELALKVLRLEQSVDPHIQGRVSHCFRSELALSDEIARVFLPTPHLVFCGRDVGSKTEKGEKFFAFFFYCPLLSGWRLYTLLHLAATLILLRLQTLTLLLKKYKKVLLFYLTVFA